MKSFKYLSLVIFIPSVVSSQISSNPVPKLNRSNIKAIVAAMTLEEKTKLVVGMGFKMPVPLPDSNKKKDSAKVAIVIEGFKLPPGDPDAEKLPEKVPGAAGRTQPIARLGIPSITVADGPAGLRIDPIRSGDIARTYYATAWPVATLLASSWDTVLVKQVGVDFGNEVLEYGVDILLAPAFNIHRNPLGGRNFEYYSEDPVVSGNISAAIVNGIESNGVGTAIKHFAANNQETNRNSVNTIVSERALREIYLKGFEIAIKKSQPWTVMSSYNLLNGTYTSERTDLLYNILRKEWGFKGFVMTDWFGGKDPVAQMKAGNDLLMPGSPNQSKTIAEAVNSGKLDIEQLDANVERILQVIIESPSFKGYRPSNKPDLRKHAQMSRQAAADGMVLLKNNDHALPLIKEKILAVFGNTSYDLIAGGTGSGDVNKAYTVSLIQGMANAGYKVEAGLKDTYENYIAGTKAKRPKPKFIFDPVVPIEEMTIPGDQLEKEATITDAAIITVGRSSGEGIDRKLDNDFKLSSAEQELIRSVSEAFHGKGKKVIVVLNIGGVIEVASWRDTPDAILLAWQPGMEGGNAIANILHGAVNPSGKLATTFPLQYEDLPSAKNFPGRELAPSSDKKESSILRGKPAEVIYEEGIYVGYRYFNSFHVKPAYEFGYGLSYTTFRYSNLSLGSTLFKGKLTASITITNSGPVAGKEVVQLYISAPSLKIEKPSAELKGFAKTNLLQPGKSQTITFVIYPKDLASFDTNRASWIAEEGDYSVRIGASSTAIKQTALFKLPKELVTEKDSNLLSPQVIINELSK